MKRKTVNKTLCGALTAIMLISLLMMPQAVNALEPTNLCLGKTATTIQLVLQQWQLMEI